MSGNKKGFGLFGSSNKPETSEDLKKKAAAAAAEAERLKGKQADTDALERKKLERLEKQKNEMMARMAGKKGMLIEQEQRKQQEAAETAAAAQRQLMEETIQRARDEVNNAMRGVQQLESDKNYMEEEIKRFQEALKQNAKDIVAANKHLVTARQALEALENPKATVTVPLSAAMTTTARDRKSSELSDTEEKHGSTSGMKKVPPPIPPKPQKNIESKVQEIKFPGLGTACIDRNGKQEFAFEGHPDEKVELSNHEPNYVSVVISGIDYGFTKDAHSDIWQAYMMNVVTDEWEEIPNNFVGAARSFQSPNRKS